MSTRPRRPRYRQIRRGNCFVCDFAHYSSASFDRCLHHDEKTRTLRLQLMRAGRVGVDETPLMRAHRTIGQAPYRPRTVMFRTAR